MRLHGRSQILLVGMLLVSLSLASCGSAAPASPSSSMTLKVAQVADGLAGLPFYIAQKQQYFEQQGLTIDPSPAPSMGSGSKLAEAVEANAVEVGVGGITDVFTISRVDAYIRMIGAISTDLLLDVVVSKKFEQESHLSASSPLEQKIHGLVGKRIGISAPGSATDALVTYLLRSQHLDAQKDVVKVNVGANSAAMLAALQTGRVDAVAVGAPGGEQAEERGIGETFISPSRGDVPNMSGQLFTVAYLKQKVIESKPQAVRAFIRGLAQAEDFIQKHPQEAERMLKEYLKLDDALAQATWQATKGSMAATPRVSKQSYEVANQFHVKAGLIALPLAYQDLVATDVITSALSGSSRA
ncbi:ABC transporter substrate-binding protein [Ktedonosporobacter rubrisoli]|uniref:ABC transporter substrate-binding protein n=1 Tax=Ktedonosporobacter rubrisoli TaxID=2509675 RepID=A0A4P6K0J8_KTERU|nr:ABC transporter substrate-binding protein [Ktedonosporobacter rubrisoli]QBD81312.1 ABC transporter substrate-binding protein [Ktedonosporobacter rubrisoli]